MSSFPGNNPMLIYQGDFYVGTFKLATTVNGVTAPIDLTGMNIDLQIRNAPGGNTLYAGTNNGTIQILNRVDVNGQFDVFMTSTITGAFTFGTGAYDIQVSSGSGSTGANQFEATTYLYGPVTVTTRVTKITY